MQWDDLTCVWWVVLRHLRWFLVSQRYSFVVHRVTPASTESSAGNDVGAPRFLKEYREEYARQQRISCMCLTQCSFDRQRACIEFHHVSLRSLAVFHGPLPPVTSTERARAQPPAQCDTNTRRLLARRVGKYPSPLLIPQRDFRTRSWRRCICGSDVCLHLLYVVPDHISSCYRMPGKLM